MFKFFKIEEFDCPCCGKNWIQLPLVKALDSLREAYGQPIHIDSGYRCKDHNAAVGGVAGSQHVYGKAADIRGDDMDKLYSLCEERFKAIGDGRSKGFIHVDMRADRVYRWTY